MFYLARRLSWQRRVTCILTYLPAVFCMLAEIILMVWILKTRLKIIRQEYLHHIEVRLLCFSLCFF